MAHRRPPRGPEQSQRRPPRRDPYDRVLIVCEGTMTEPQYFRELIGAYHLNTANVVVVPGRRSDPVAVVETAVAVYTTDDDFEGVYVVLDQDVPTYARAAERRGEIEMGTNAPPGLGAVLHVVPSMPCFEYWLLLHFEDTARPYGQGGRRSACAECVRDLTRHLPGYTKGGTGTFAATHPYLVDALARAVRRVRATSGDDQPNPVTHVHTLVERLRTLSAPAE